MLKINSMAPPSAEQLSLVFKSLNSESDSRIAQIAGKVFLIGKTDKAVALKLIKDGDCEFLKQLPVVMEITAPLYWWMQIGKYSKPTLTKKEFTNDDFSIDQFCKMDCDDGEKLRFFGDGVDFEGFHVYDDGVNGVEYFEVHVTALLEALRRKYNETGEKRYLNALVELLPQSYNQTKIWNLSYETAIKIGLEQDNELTDYWKDNLPYYTEFLEAAKSKSNEMKQLQEENAKLKDNLSAIEKNFDRLLDWQLDTMVKARYVRQERNNLIIDFDKLKKENRDLWEAMNKID